MKKSRLLGAVCATVCCFILTSSHAALIPISLPGGNVVYDEDRDITWLQDANYAMTSGFDSDGHMGWLQAQQFVQTLNSIDHLGFSDWRLPTTQNPDNNCTNSDGSPSFDSTGWDCTGSELGHLFYDEFGADRLTSALNTGAPSELAKFSNIQAINGSHQYWSDSANTDFAWSFSFHEGLQDKTIKPATINVWVVRDGNVVPIPPSVWLFGSGLLGLVGLARRKAV